MSRTAATPERSMEQRMDALRKANVRRMHRASVKRGLKGGLVDVEQVLADPLCDTMKVREVLLAVPALGPCKVDRLMRQVGISPAKTCRGLTPRQRDYLLAMLLVKAWRTT